MSEKRLLTSDETEEFLERLAESSSNSQEKSKENMEMMNVFKQEFDQNGSQENIFNFFEFFTKSIGGTMRCPRKMLGRFF